MQQSRPVLAIVLCALIWLIGSQLFFPPVEKKPDPGPSQNSTTPTPNSPANLPESGGSEASIAALGGLEPNDPSEATLTSDVLVLEVSSLGAGVAAARLPEYEENESDPDVHSSLAIFDRQMFEVPSAARVGVGSKQALALEIDGIPGLSELHWKQESATSSEVSYSIALGQGRTLRKTLRIVGPDQPYLATLDLTFQGFTGGNYRLLGPERIRFDLGSRESNGRVTGLAGVGGEFIGVEREAMSILENGEKRDLRPSAWVAMESNYFAYVLRPLFDAHGPVLERGTADENQNSLLGPLQENGIQGLPFRVGFEPPIPEDGVTHSFELFFGPKDRVLLALYEEQGYDELVNFGSILGSLVRVFLWLLALFNSWFGSYGIAIICLTVVVKVALHPINKRNQSMMQRQQKKMAKIQPKLNKAKEQHKNDPVRANQEMQRLMREHEVNPAAMFGGCLLIFLQLPIWIGLISTFSLALELRHESFLWFADLTQPDRLLYWGGNLPLLGQYLNLLPFLYVGLTLINQSMMPKSSEPQMQQQQKMMKFMMVAFGFIFYQFPSGLLLYFLTSAGLGIFEQRIIKAELKREGLG